MTVTSVARPADTRPEDNRTRPVDAQPGTRRVDEVIASLRGA